MRFLALDIGEVKSCPEACSISSGPKAIATGRLSLTTIPEQITNVWLWLESQNSMYTDHQKLTASGISSVEAHF
jgi:hypothetical protein